jgi:hypothetical protein
LSTIKEPARDLDFEVQLERDLLGVDEDADGESDDEFEEIVPRPVHLQKQEEEEEEEKEDTTITARTQSPAPPPNKAKRARPANLPVKGRASEVPPLEKSKTPARGKGGAKREHVGAVAEEVEEENLEFGQPAQAKRGRPSPPSERLALPGSSSAVQTPATYAIPYPAHSNSHLSVSRLASPPNAALSDSEEDWDEVKPAGEMPMDVDEADADGEDEEEIDMNLFEAELNEHLGEGSDDFLVAAVSPEPEMLEHPNARGRPMSLNQFAAGRGEGSQDEDEYSSSEDSDDD